jgi:glyoxylase-like metal-dependent hydrolase (beta-lactamase superfamily II)
MSRTSAAALLLVCACGDDAASGAATGAGGGGEGASGPTGATTSAGPGGAGGEGTGGDAPSNNGFPPAWPNGTACSPDDDIFVWEYAEDTFILRQSLCTSFEGPFLYLLFGEDRALLEDTGDGGILLQQTVQGIIDAWLARKQRASIELIVAHSHGHGDHVGGDGQFQGQPSTQVVGLSSSAVASFFGIGSWPDEIAAFDLGGRVLDVIPIPGHQSAHVAFYDRRHRLLLTGDTLYPGRLYIDDFAAYGASVRRMSDFAAQRGDVAWILGTHIEMTTSPGVDFPFGADAHPNEHALELTPAHLSELDAAVQAMGGTPSYEVHDDFIIYPL